jgi:hypothetical protein
MFRRSTLIATSICTCAVLITAIPARAQSTGTSDQQPRFRVYFDDRPGVEFGKDVRVELGGRLDGDLRTDDSADRDRGSLEWGGKRLELSGRVTRYVDFEISRELADNRPWRDVWVEVGRTAALAVRLGRFKVPFSQDRLRSQSRLDFVNRSMAADRLAPGRNDGVMTHGETAKERITYAVGVFRNRDPEGIEDDPALDDLDRDQRALGAARVTAKPFLSWRDGKTLFESLQVGVAVTRDRSLPSLTRFGASTLDNDDDIFEPVYINGPRTGVGTELHWTPGRARINAEWMQIRETRDGQAFGGGDLPDFLGRGWYISGVYRVARWRDKNRDWLTRSVLREVEIGARLEGIAFGTGTSATDVVTHPRAEIIPWHGLHALTLGATWRLNRFSRIQLNAITEKPEVPLSEPSNPGTERRWSGVVKFQIAL